MKFITVNQEINWKYILTLHSNVIGSPASTICDSINGGMNSGAFPDTLICVTVSLDLLQACPAGLRNVTEKFPVSSKRTFEITSWLVVEVVVIYLWKKKKVFVSRFGMYWTKQFIQFI